MSLDDLLDGESLLEEVPKAVSHLASAFFHIVLLGVELRNFLLQVNRYFCVLRSLLLRLARAGVITVAELLDDLLVCVHAVAESAFVLMQTLLNLAVHL